MGPLQIMQCIAEEYGEYRRREGAAEEQYNQKLREKVETETDMKDVATYNVALREARAACGGIRAILYRLAEAEEQVD